ncbi:hypothetical protein TRVL_08640 [Trypanosoma vivax]|nr:hypothetical protein TRVL_08640 [Trypanosoma vivax]
MTGDATSLVLLFFAGLLSNASYPTHGFAANSTPLVPSLRPRPHANLLQCLLTKIVCTATRKSAPRQFTSNCAMRSNWCISSVVAGNCFYSTLRSSKAICVEYCPVYEREVPLLLRGNATKKRTSVTSHAILGRYYVFIPQLYNAMRVKAGTFSIYNYTACSNRCIGNEGLCI